MAKLDGRGRQRHDKKRSNGSFRPQGKKGAKKRRRPSSGGHVNKYEQFSQAGSAMARHEASKAAADARKAREAQEQHMGWSRQSRGRYSSWL